MIQANAISADNMTAARAANLTWFSNGPFFSSRYAHKGLARIGCVFFIESYRYADGPRRWRINMASGSHVTSGVCGPYDTRAHAVASLNRLARMQRKALALLVIRHYLTRWHWADDEYIATGAREHMTPLYGDEYSGDWVALVSEARNAN